MQFVRDYLALQNTGDVPLVGQPAPQQTFLRAGWDEVLHLHGREESRARPALRLWSCSDLGLAAPFPQLCLLEVREQSRTAPVLLRSQRWEADLTSEHRDPKKQQMEKDTSIKRIQIVH